MSNRRSLWRSLALAATLVIGLAGCGGAQQPADALQPPTEAAPAAPAPPERSMDDRMWLVSWQGILVLTVYPLPGPVQAHRHAPDGPPPFGGRHRHFSAVSHYADRQAALAPVLAEAQSVEGLLEALRADPDYVVEQVRNPSAGGF